MNKSNNSQADWLALYKKYDSWQEVHQGYRAEIRRVVHPDDLIEVPAYYRLAQGFRPGEGLRRLVYCLPFLKHQDNGMSLGRALAQPVHKVNEKRLFMVMRTQAPNDLIQLRRLLQQVKPTVDFNRTAWLLLQWDKPEKKQTLLEDFFLYQNDTAKTQS